MFFFALLGLLAVGSAFKDGDLYKFTSAVDNNTISVSGKEISAGNNITAEAWRDSPNQKWLAVQAGIATGKYLLLPQHQHWDWKKFAAKGTRDRQDDLPDFSMVMAVDVNSGAVSQQVRDGKPAQQWRVSDVGKGKVLIKSVANDKCIKNPGAEAASDSHNVLAAAKKTVSSILHGGSKKEKKLQLAILQAVECDGYDPHQQFILDATA